MKNFDIKKIMVLLVQLIVIIVLTAILVLLVLMHVGLLEKLFQSDRYCNDESKIKAHLLESKIESIYKMKNNKYVIDAKSFAGEDCQKLYVIHPYSGDKIKRILSEWKCFEKWEEQIDGGGAARHILINTGNLFIPVFTYSKLTGKT